MKKITFNEFNEQYRKNQRADKELQEAIALVKEKKAKIQEDLLKQLFDIESYNVKYEHGKYYDEIDGIRFGFKQDRYNNIYDFNMSELPSINILKKIVYYCLCFKQSSIESCYANRISSHILFEVFRKFHKQINKEYFRELLKLGDEIPVEAPYCRFRDWALGSSYCSVGYLSEFKNWDYGEFQNGTEKYKPVKGEYYVKGEY